MRIRRIKYSLIKFINVSYEVMTRTTYKKRAFGSLLTEASAFRDPRRPVSGPFTLTVSQALSVLASRPIVLESVQARVL